jgi:hypothetical protein
MRRREFITFSAVRLCGRLAQKQTWRGQTAT